MAASYKLMAIKSLHTLIWSGYNIVIFYLLYAVIMDRIDQFFWIGLALVGLEVIVLLAFRLYCPLTLVARRYSDSTAANFDIYLPLWLAKYNKQIYGGVMVLVLIGMVIRLVE